MSSVYVVWDRSSSYSSKIKKKCYSVHSLCLCVATGACSMSFIIDINRLLYVNPYRRYENNGNQLNMDCVWLALNFNCIFVLDWMLVLVHNAQ